MINLAFDAFEQLSSSDVCKLKSLQPGNTVLKKRANIDQETKIANYFLFQSVETDQETKITNYFLFQNVENCARCCLTSSSELRHCPQRKIL